jgi:arsenite methyltransferase
MSAAADQIKTQIKERFIKVALEPLARQPFPIGATSAKRLGYADAEIGTLPIQLTESFAGVGNPFALGELRAGDIVLDLGSGAGMDSLIAARKVGQTGRVIGIDMTEAMVEKAKANAEAVGAANVKFHHGEVDHLPLNDGSVDIVISNGVFNLCLDKPKVLEEVFRVLRPGGRLQMADILLDDGVTPEEVESKGAWSD